MSSPVSSTALLFAVERDDLERVTELLASGIDPNCVNPQGWTPLMVAAFGTNVAMVHALVRAGAQVNRQARNGSTALMKAALWGRLEIVEALLALGADPTVHDSEGWTAERIAHACGYGEIGRLLADQRRNRSSRGPSPGQGGARQSVDSAKATRRDNELGNAPPEGHDVAK